MALLSFVFVILAGVGSALKLVATASSLWGWIPVVLQVLGYGLQIFAAIWFFGLAVSVWYDHTNASRRGL
jgi:hypothetical protein